MRYIFTRKGQPRGWIESWDGVVVLTSPGFEWAMQASVLVVLDWAVGKFASSSEENKEYTHNEITFANARTAHAYKLRQERATFFVIIPPTIEDND